MEIFDALMAGFANAATPANLLWALFGCALGTAVGVLPGIGPAVAVAVAVAVAMLLPITAKVEITASMIFFAGIYYGTMYGGSTTSILLNTPGETASMVTAMEGNKMAKSGRAGAALATSAIGSFVAGTIATVIVTLFAPFVANFAVRLGPPEYFLLMVLAFTTVSAVLGQSTVRGMTALFIGLTAGCIGMDQISGAARYTGGKPEMLDGIDIVLVAVGLFAVAEVLYAGLFEGRVQESSNHMGRVHTTRRDWKRSIPAWLRGTALGAPFGCIPAGGAKTPTFLSYAVEKKLAKGEDAAEFGTQGAIEGVAGPEAANNATVTTRNDSAADAGHSHFQHHRRAAGRFSKLRHQPRPAAVHHVGYVDVGADCLALHQQRDAAGAQPDDGRTVGQAAQDPQTAAIRRHSDLRHRGRLRYAPERFRPVPALWHRLLGVLMRRFDFPTAPVVIGMILGPLAEAQMRNAVAIGEGSWTIFVTRPMSLTLVVVVLAVLAMPRVLRYMARTRIPG